MTATPALVPAIKVRRVEGLYLLEALPVPKSDQPTIVFVHGAFHGAWAYREWLRYFALRGWRAIALSLRNHPGSRRVTPEAFLRVGLTDYVDDVQSVLSRIDAGVCVVGHSIGGLVVQMLAETYGVGGAILVASVGPGQLGAHDADFPPDRPVDYREQYRSQRNLYDFEDRRFEQILRKLVPESPRALNQARGRTFIDASRLSCPILVVGCGRDETKVHSARRIAAFYNADLFIAANATHDVMLGGDAVGVARQMECWLRSQQLGPPERDEAHERVARTSGR